MSMSVEEFLREHGAERSIRDDWEVRTGPAGTVVTAWTSDRFRHAEEATRVAERLLHDILTLDYRVAGLCDVDAERDPDGDWRGHLRVRLQAVAPRPAAPLGA
jgi:hypothetical protein